MDLSGKARRGCDLAVLCFCAQLWGHKHKSSRGSRRANQTELHYLCPPFLCFTLYFCRPPPPEFTFLLRSLPHPFFSNYRFHLVTHPHSPAFVWLLSCHRFVICIFDPVLERNQSGIRRKKKRSGAAVEADWLESRLWCMGCLGWIECQTSQRS